MTVMTKTDQDMLSFKQAIDYTGFSTSALYKLVHNKQIPYSKPTGGKLFFRLGDLREFLSKGRVSSNDEVASLAQAV